MSWAAWLFRRPARRPFGAARSPRLRFELLEHREVPASIAGNVFKDFNNNGALNGPDSGISGVTITVSGSTLTSPQTATTDSSGNFTLSGLSAGTYTITASGTTGTAGGKATAGTAGGTVGNNNIITGITVTADQAATGYTFGQVPNNLTAGGKVFNDVNGNGTQDTGEAGISGVTVTLNGTSVVTNAAITARLATTGADGSYSFAALVPGTYTLTETPKTGFVRGALQNGTPAATSTANGTFTGIDLSSTAAAATGFNFADVKPANVTITQSVNDSRINPGEPVVLTYTAKNTGTLTAADIASAVNLDGLKFVSATGEGYTAATNTWNVGSLDAGETATLTIRAMAPSRDLYLPSTRLVSLTGGAAVVGDTAFAAVSSRPQRVSMQSFLTTTFRKQTLVGNVGAVVYPDAPTNDDIAPAAPTVQFFNAAGTTALTNATTAEPTTVIKGTTSANTLVTLVQTGATTTSDASGNYTFSNIALNTGSNAFTLKAGTGTNTSQTASTVNRTGTAPTTPTVQFFNAAGTTALTNSSTTETTTTIKGTTAASTPLTLVETGATTTSDSTGAYTFSAVNVTLGANSFTVRAGTGNSTSQTTATVTRTAVAPTLLLYDAAGTNQLTAGTTTDATTVIKGITSPNTPLTLVETGATTTSDSTGNYTFTNVPAAVGSNTYTVRAGTGTGAPQTAGTLTRTAVNVAPTIATQQTAIALSDGQISQSIDLAGKFTDANLTSTKVKFVTSLGDVNLDLFDKQAPQTVTNFLNYVTDGDYNNSIFHRSVTNFVLQGGGFGYNGTGTPSISTVPGDPAVQNEPDSVSRSNLRGTVAMAKLGGNPNSATNQFFFNLGNNASNLDNQNGGFTVFGKVSGTADQAVVDALAAIPKQDKSSSPALPASQQGVFDSIPLRNYTGTNFPSDTTLANYAAITSATIVSQPEVLTYSIVSNSNTAAVTATIVKNRVTVTRVAGQTGVATITVRATDKAGLSTDMTFTVNVT